MPKTDRYLTYAMHPASMEGEVPPHKQTNKRRIMSSCTSNCCKSLKISLQSASLTLWAPWSKWSILEGCYFHSHILTLWNRMVHPAAWKGNIIYPPQSLLLEPNKYSNPILRISVTSNLSKHPPLVGIQSELTIQNIKNVSQYVF